MALVRWDPIRDTAKGNKALFGDVFTPSSRPNRIFGGG